jgi:hypothetical protein
MGLTWEYDALEREIAALDLAQRPRRRGGRRPRGGDRGREGPPRQWRTGGGAELRGENRRARRGVEEGAATTAAGKPLGVAGGETGDFERGKRSDWGGADGDRKEEENAALPSEIARVTVSIAKLRRKLALRETGQGSFSDLRVAAFGEDVSMKTAMAFIKATMERLENGIVSKRTGWTEQRN